MWTANMNNKPKKKRRPAKPKPREFYVLETETGWDIKRYYHSFHHTLEQAQAFKRYLDLKDLYDKREILHVREIKK